MKRPPSDNERAQIAEALRGDPLAPIPIIADGVEARADLQGLVQLRAVPEVQPGLLSEVARKLGMHRNVRVNLDDYGSVFWRLIDGRRTLREIARQVQQQTEQPAEDVEKAVIQFTKMLMKRHLIMLAIPKHEE